MTPTELVAALVICGPILGTEMRLMQHRVSSRHFSQCAVEAVSHFNVENTDIMYFVSQDVEEKFSVTGDILKLLQVQITRGVVVTSFAKVSNCFKRGSHKYNYIIETKNARELIEAIDLLSSFPNWNSHAAFLIISKKTFEQPHDIAVEYSEILWRKHAVRVAVLLLSNRNNSICEIYSRNPFQKPSTKNTLPKHHCLFGKFRENMTLFGETLAKCSNNCTFKVNYIDWPPLVINADQGYQPSNYFLTQGFDINLLNMIASKLNLTLLYNTTGTLWGNILENGTVQGNLALLLNNSVDILVGGYRKTAERAQYFDVTDSHIQSYEVWCVSNTPVMVGFRSMGNIFRLEVWILAILIYLLLWIFIYISSNREVHEFTAYKNADDALLINLAVLLGVGGNVLPRGRRTRYFTIVLVVFGFYVTLFYSSYLTSIISAPKYVQKYNSIKDIYDYNLETYFMQDDIKWILKDNSVTSIVPADVIKRRWRNCYNITWCFDKVATEKATSFCTYDLHKDYFLAPNSYPMHCMQYNKVGTPAAITLRKGFPFYKQFNIIINRIIEAGMVSKWAKDIYKTKSSSRASGNLENASIRFENLLPIFKFLLVGNFVALIVFVVEVVIKNY